MDQSSPGTPTGAPPGSKIVNPITPDPRRVGEEWANDPRVGWYLYGRQGAYLPTISFVDSTVVATGLGADTVAGITVAEIEDPLISYTLSLGTIIINTPAIYLVVGNWVFPATAGGAARFGRVNSTGSGEICRSVAPTTGGAISSGGSGARILSIPAGEQIYIGARQDSGGNITTTMRVSLSLLRPTE